MPEFYNEQVTWYIKIPQFKLIHSAATYAEESKKKAEELTVQTNEGIKQDVAEIRDIYREELLHAAAAVAAETRDKMTKEYNVNPAYSMEPSKVCRLRLRPCRRPSEQSTRKV